MLLWDIPFQDNLRRPSTLFGVLVMSRIALLASAVLMTACAQTQMVNRGNPAANYYTDRAGCEQEAFAKYPDVVVPVTPTSPQFTTNCQRVGIQTQCTTRQLDTSTQDRNSAQIQQGVLNRGRQMSRSLEIGSCMSRKGWVSERVN
jgi:hypothetical protein